MCNISPYKFPDEELTKDEEFIDEELYKKEDYFLKAPRLRRVIQEKDFELNTLKEESNMTISPEVRELTSSLQESINFYSLLIIPI